MHISILLKICQHLTVYFKQLSLSKIRMKKCFQLKIVLLENLLQFLGTLFGHPWEVNTIENPWHYHRFLFLFFLQVNNVQRTYNFVYNCPFSILTALQRARYVFNCLKNFLFVIKLPTQLVIFCKTALCQGVGSINKKLLSDQQISAVKCVMKGSRARNPLKKENL